MGQDNILIKKAFWFNYLKLRNISEAAIKAGFSEKDAFFEGMKILEKSQTQRALNRISERVNFGGNVRAGLERLAFGSINDAVKLAFLDEMPSENELSGFDLFNVSEIKRVKGGGVEIKLFDRLKALEKLWEIENTAEVNSSAESFFNAIKAGGFSSSQNEGECEND